MNLRVVGILLGFLGVLVACGNEGTSSTGSGAASSDKVLLRLNLPQGDTFQVLTIQEEAFVST